MKLTISLRTNYDGSLTTEIEPVHLVNDRDFVAAFALLNTCWAQMKEVNAELAKAAETEALKDLGLMP